MNTIFTFFAQHCNCALTRLQLVAKPCRGAQALLGLAQLLLQCADLRLQLCLLLLLLLQLLAYAVRGGFDVVLLVCRGREQNFSN